MKSLPTIIFYLILAGLSCSFIKLYFAQNDLESILAEGVFPWYFKVHFIGNVLISMASISSFVLYRKHFPNFVSTCYILLIVFVVFASLGDLSDTLKTPSFFYSTKGIGTFINIGILFFAADAVNFPKILKFFFYACIGVILAGFVNLGKVGMGAGRMEFLLVIRDFTVFLIWVFPYFFLQDEPDKRKNILTIGIFLIIFIFILSSGSRSYLLLYMVYIGVKFRAQLQSRVGIVTILGLVVLAVAGYFIITNSSLNKTFGTAVDNLTQRSSEDTRSSQLIDFLSQYDLSYLIQGVGPFKQWNWHGFGMYSFLDNQFLLLSWWAGLPTLLAYAYFLIRSVRTKSEILLFENVKGLKLIITLWIGACLGFAVYVTISCDAYYYFLSLLMGMMTCKYTQLLDAEHE